MKVTATDIAWHMRNHAMGMQHEWITPNAMLYAWESDLLTVTRSSMVHEFEIKCTRADLLQDLKKPKHSQGQLLHGHFLDKPKGQGWTIPESKEDDRKRAGAIVCRRPNYFSFAMPCEIFRKLAHGTLPTYAGIYTVDEYGRVRQEHAPRQLHREAISNEDLLALARRIHYRYWNELRAARQAAKAQPAAR